MPRLGDLQRQQVVAEREAGRSVDFTARKVNVSRQAIYDLLKKHKQTGAVSDIPHRRRPRVSNQRDDRRLLRLSAANPCLVSKQLANEWAGVHASAVTVRRRLLAAGVRSCLAPRKPALSIKNKRARLQFARTHATWSIAQWQQVIWTDETPLHLSDTTSSRYVKLRKGISRLSITQPTFHSGGGHLLVWGGFHGDTVLPLRLIDGVLNGNKYLHLLQEVFPTCAAALTWMDDNAPAHRSRQVTQWMVQQGRRRLLWPAQSPDINPLENAWSELKRRLQDKHLSSLQNLWNVAHTEWELIGAAYFSKLIETMPRRMAAVIKAKGGHIKY